MECNKDEAVRAKELAERKFSESEYAGAKKLALKAQNLCPALDGISQFLAILDVYISAENKVSGEMDWHGILKVNPCDDDETVRKHYKMLALTLHPDTNKSLGAEGAFKLVSEAWSMLSDKNKRQAYNNQQNSLNHVRSQTEGPCSNGVNTFSKNVTTNVRNGNNNTRSRPTSVPPPQKKSSTFWTICNRCKTHYEYLKIYLNHTLICPTCNQHFLAVDMPPPPNIFKSGNRSSSQQRQNSQQHTASHNTGAGDSSGRLFNNTSSQSKMTGYGNRDGSSSEWERSQISKRADGSFYKVDKTLKKRKTDEVHMNGNPGYMTNHVGMGHGVAEFGHVSGITSKPNSMRELGLIEIRNMLMHKAQSDLRKKVEEWRSTIEAKNTKKHKQNKRTKSTLNGSTPDVEKHVESALNGNQCLDVDSIKVDQAFATINVPDSDFHNFDLDRAESSFEEDQVWAAYDDDDGMPRFYARIYKVISLKPFKMRISWLNSRSNSELGPIDWVGSGFYKTCGDFRTGKHEIAASLNSFSHKVKWTRGNRGAVRIFPGKGEVWALYRNWSPDWSQCTPDEVIHKYDMVEVVEDFDEEQGVAVTPLVKVSGFKTVFDKYGDPDGLRRIPKEELFRFSHQVPYYLLTGQEAHNAPKGCRELDPAATPLDLQQQSVTEVNKASDDVGKHREDTLLSSTEKCRFRMQENDTAKTNSSEMVGGDGEAEKLC